LGDSEAALSYAGLEEPSKANTKGIAGVALDDELAQFVVQSALTATTSAGDPIPEDANDVDVLPGICALSERWINETLIPSAPELNGCDFTLSDWFDDQQIALQLEMLEKARMVGLDRATMAVSDSFKAVGSTVKRAGRKISGALAGISAALGTLKARAASLTGSGQGSEWDGYEEEARELPLSGRQATSLATRAMASVRALVPAMLPAGDEDELTEQLPRVNAQLKAYARKRNAARNLALAAGSAVTVGLVGAYGVHSRHVRAPESVVAVVDRFIDTLSLGGGSKRRKAREEMSVKVAEDCVRSWQAVKSKALGREHDIAGLAAALDGRMLQQWKARAQDVRSQGWYWEYSLGNLSIDSVEVSEDGERAIVEATLEESARLIEGDNPKATDQYKSQYSAQYQLVQRPAGWRIVGGKVIHR